MLLEGEFGKSFTHADNSQIIPTETQKNTLYALAKKYPVEPIETWGQNVARDLMSRHAHVRGVRVEIEEQPWVRIRVEGKEHNHAFRKGLSGQRFCKLYVPRHGQVEVLSGFKDLAVMKTAQSGFVGYIKDQYTTLGGMF